MILLGTKSPPTSVAITIMSTQLFTSCHLPLELCYSPIRSQRLPSSTNSWGPLPDHLRSCPRLAELQLLMTHVKWNPLDLNSSSTSRIPRETYCNTLSSQPHQAHVQDTLFSLQIIHHFTAYLSPDAQYHQCLIASFGLPLLAV